MTDTKGENMTTNESTIRFRDNLVTIDGETFDAERIVRAAMEVYLSFTEYGNPADKAALEFIAGRDRSAEDIMAERGAALMELNESLENGNSGPLVGRNPSDPFDLTPDASGRGL